MAGKSICSVEGCGKSARARGMCSSHDRFNTIYGSPTARKYAPKGDTMKFIMETALPYEGDDCLFWPWKSPDSKDGRASVWYEGRTTNPARVVCRLTHGEPPAKGYDAAHSCGNGHKACVNPRHISWKTRLENVADMIDHGTKRYGENMHSSKLTEADALYILNARGKESTASLVARFGVLQNTISRIQTGKRWGHLQRK